MGAGKSKSSVLSANNNNWRDLVDEYFTESFLTGGLLDSFREDSLQKYILDFEDGKLSTIKPENIVESLARRGVVYGMSFYENFALGLSIETLDFSTLPTGSRAYIEKIGFPIHSAMYAFNQIVPKMDKLFRSETGHNIQRLAFSDNMVTERGSAGVTMRGRSSVKNTLVISVNDPAMNNKNTARTMSHELGHVLYSNLENSKTYRNSLSYFNKSVTEQKLRGVTAYANASKKEAFAEAFSLYTGGVPIMNVSVGKQYYREFNTLMKSIGLEDLKGSVKHNKKLTMKDL